MEVSDWIVPLEEQKHVGGKLLTLPTVSRVLSSIPIHGMKKQDVFVQHHDAVLSHLWRSWGQSH